MPSAAAARTAVIRRRVQAVAIDGGELRRLATRPAQFPVAWSAMTLRRSSCLTTSRRYVSKAALVQEVGEARVGDEIDGWVFDERFIRSGVHEPAARTRAAIARHGGKQTSWRQHGVPAGAETRHRQAGQIEDQLRGQRSCGGLSRRRQTRRWLLAALSGTMALLGILQWTGHGLVPRGRIIQAGPARAIIPSSIHSSAAPDTPDHLVHGISPSTPIGTCFTASDASSGASQPLILNQVSCDGVHYLQLVSIDRALGSSLSYPDENYWQRPVQQACETDLVGFAHRPAAATLSSTLTMTFFRPTRSSWSLGDRTVYCVLHSVQPLTASVCG